MKQIALPLVLAAGLSFPLPGLAQEGIGDVIGGVARAMLGQELDRNAWNQAQSRNTTAAYESYLSNFPQGGFRQEAIAAINRLRGTTGTPPSGGAQATAPELAEAALNLSNARRREVQRQLTSLGYNTGGTDGVWGAGTRQAIRSWQRDNGFAVTGYVAAQDLTLIARQVGDQGGTGSTPQVTTPAAAEAALGLSRAERVKVQQDLTALGYNTRGVDGVWGNGTRQAIRSWQSANGSAATGYVTAQDIALLERQAGSRTPVVPAPVPDNRADEAAERALGLSVSERREVQLRLTLLGHDTEGTSGSFDARTRTALRAWQRSQGMTQTGYLNADQLRALQRQTRG